MKKQNLLKLAFTMLAMVFMTGVMAQTINHDDDVATGTNYVEAGDTITYQTENFDLRLYVLPDAVYNTDYNGTGVAGTGLSSTSRWRWVYGASYEWLVDDADGTPATEVKDTTKQNWVDLVAGTHFPAAGASRLFWVLETNTNFGCEGSATSHELFVVGTPTADIVGRGDDGTNTWDVETAGTQFRRCADGTPIGDTIDITFTETGAPAAAQEYTIGLSVEQTALDQNLNPTGTAYDVTGTYGKTAAPTSLAPGLTQTHTVPGLPLISANTPTRYTFSITANSIYSMISKTSQLRAGAAEAGFTGAATTITYTILPAPTTGPIYHIPNAFD